MSTDARITLYGPGPIPGGLVAAFTGDSPAHVKLVAVSLESTNDPVADVAFAAATMARHALYGQESPGPGTLFVPRVVDWPRSEEEETPPLSQPGTPDTDKDAF